MMPSMTARHLTEARTPRRGIDIYRVCFDLVQLALDEMAALTDYSQLHW